MSYPATDRVADRSVIEPLENRRLMTAASAYTVTDLFPFESTGGAGIENGDKNTPSINAGGVVAGTGLKPSGLHSHATARFVKKGKVTLVDVGNFKLDDVSDAKGLNDLNQFVGAYEAGTATDHAFLSYLGKKGRVVLEPLGDFKGLPGTVAYAINNRGQIVGSAGQLTGEELAVMWTIGKKGAIVPYALPRFGGHPIPGLELTSIANDINEGGIIAGAAQDETLQQRATLWMPSKKGRYSPVALPGFGGGVMGAIDSAYAKAINENNVVVGQGVNEGVKEHAAAWLPGKKGRFSIVDLDGPRGSTGEGSALSVNNSNVIVGKTDFGSDDHATMWVPGRKGRFSAVDLNRFLPKGSPWVLKEATSINDDGVIVGHGTFNGGTRQWMLVPASDGSLALQSAAAAEPQASAKAAAPATTPATKAPQVTNVFSQLTVTEDLLA
jgi:uncharacterized membrane protein